MWLSPTAACSLLTGVVLAACASAPVPAPRTVTTAPTVALDTDTCPMNVDSAVVRAEPIDGGAALVFTTPGDCAELRRRVRDIARLHSFRVLETNATLIVATDDIAHGIRLNIRAVDANRGARLHDTAAARASQLARGACPAMNVDAMIAWVSDPDATQQAVVSSR